VSGYGPAMPRETEPHLDAVAILDEAALAAPADGVCGVWAAEGPGRRLEATELPGSWCLTGSKPWCSLAAEVSHALTAWVDDERHQLFLVDLDQPGVRVVDAPWVARGRAAVRSTPVELDQVVATPVGGPEWYLRRDGFAWGGIGVAAVWYGATVAVARRLWRQAAERELDQVGHLHLGTVDAALTAASTLLTTAEDVDAGRATGAAEVVLRAADHPAERDTAALGRMIGGDCPW
jgi:hypothetical protein